MAMTIVENQTVITGGVDTHLDVHVAAAIDANGGVLGVETFPTRGAGYAQLVCWLRRFGPIEPFADRRIDRGKIRTVAGTAATQVRA
jgi:hypothetical protein